MIKTRTRWACLRCDAQGSGTSSDLDARKHMKATGHDTITHISDGSDAGLWTELVTRIREQLAAVPNVNK